MPAIIRPKAVNRLQAGANQRGTPWVRIIGNSQLAPRITSDKIATVINNADRAPNSRTIAIF